MQKSSRGWQGWMPILDSASSSLSAGLSLVATPALPVWGPAPAENVTWFPELDKGWTCLDPGWEVTLGATQFATDGKQRLTLGLPLASRQRNWVPGSGSCGVRHRDGARGSLAQCLESLESSLVWEKVALLLTGDLRSLFSGPVSALGSFLPAALDGMGPQSLAWPPDLVVCHGRVRVGAGRVAESWLLFRDLGRGEAEY